MTVQAADSKYLVKLTPENAVLVLIDYLTGFMSGLKSIDESCCCIPRIGCGSLGNGQVIQVDGGLL